MSGEGAGIIDLAARYDEFQSAAVKNIVADYSDNTAGRYLLVIPTGGGKTFTAVKAINSLFHKGVINPDSERVVWAAHRQELVKQANDTFGKFHERSSESSYQERVHIMMISGVANYIRDNKDVKLVVIDEAHHAAISNVQYGPLFDYPNLGILGLTATPSRHDGKPLDFEKESFSIGYPDLIEKQIILSPEIRELVGGRFEGIAAQGSTFSGLDDLSTPERNQRIIKHIEENVESYSKIIIYAGSVSHTKDLYKQVRNSSLLESYEAVDYIVGEGWSGNDEDREDFIARLKSYRRSIVINHDVLSEGYDDPKVNTIIMARPSKSKLVYMQAVGRGVRIDPENPSKRAFIVEVVDKLPNIRYRIDNRWLFSEISDRLEPQVTDEIYGSAAEFKAALLRLYENYAVASEYRFIPDWNERSRYSVLLFRYFVGNDTYRHIPIVIDKESRSAVSNWFNFLSAHMDSFRRGGINPEQAMIMARYKAVPGLGDRKTRLLIADAMEEASKQIAAEYTPAQDVTYWISYVALRYRQKELPEDLLGFIDLMVNREQIREELVERHFQSGSQLVRFPLPLCGYVGQIITKTEFDKLYVIISGLEELKDSSGNLDHRDAVRDLMNGSVLPVDLIYRDALGLIVREGESFHMRLE